MKICCKKINFSHNENELIKNLNLEINENQHIWIRGNSGAGKSSFLKLIAGTLTPLSGSIQLGNCSFSDLTNEKKDQFRQNNIGFIDQESHLVEHWTVKQNLNLINQEILKFSEELNQVGLSSNIQHNLISQLSGGEKQRISFVRLLLQHPKVALLDEPTAHLDDLNTNRILNLIEGRLSETTVIIVSHDARLLRFFPKPIEFSEINA